MYLNVALKVFGARRSQHLTRLHLGTPKLKGILQRFVHSLGCELAGHL